MGNVQHLCARCPVLECLVKQAFYTQLLALNVFVIFRFFLELMVKSMIEHLGSSQRLDLPRKQRFPDRFLEDIARLVGLITTEILVRQHRDGKESKVSHLRGCYQFSHFNVFLLFYRVL